MLLNAVFFLLHAVLQLASWAIIIAAIISLLIAFNILDTRNRMVWSIADFFHRLTEPLLRPVRNRIPNFGNIDISPIVVLLLIQALTILLAAIQTKMITNGLYF
ncbi:YggT family protein [Rhodovarius crocodyli]|uniref:YggT family protein n=1 Tax=Rhodovarius crocodyli TaxID=1979269 RepID=A0A437MMM4_9PROT|nr:YggT family protein [Rhodovarius crocodyli]RVT98907.1 YggT family protein [Rhodovarius crocodyli]